MARLVSMIPYMEDSSIDKKRGDVWCTNSEFLHMAAGDSEEHAHLLAGFFMEIGQQVRGRGGCGQEDDQSPLSLDSWVSLSPLPSPTLFLTHTLTITFSIPYSLSLTHSPSHTPLSPRPSSFWGSPRWAPALPLSSRPGSAPTTRTTR
jgi:hypothetical protein